MSNLSKKEYKKFKKRADRRKENQIIRNLPKNDGSVGCSGISYFEDPQAWRIEKLRDKGWLF